MQKKLIIGRTYAVTASTTCDVTDANGALITTAYPGQQIVFVAPTTTVSFTDDAASVVAVFNSALAKTRLFEQLGGGRLPSGYLPALFLESTGAQYINTGIIPFTGAEKCTVGMEIDGLVTGPGSATSCMIAGCGASGSTWFSPYRWWNEESAYTAFFLQQNEYPVSSPYNNRIRCSLNFLKSGVVKYSANGGDAKTVSITHEVKNLSRYILLFGGDQKGDPRAAARIWSAKISDGAALVRAYVPAITPAGAPCMFDRVRQAAAKNNDTDSEFIVGMTVAQARNLWQLPADAEKKTLTISLPQSAFVDLETGEIADAAVNAALAQAEAKDWVITKQYYTES